MQCSIRLNDPLKIEHQSSGIGTEILSIIEGKLTKFTKNK